jgi:hypothetical protein
MGRGAVVNRTPAEHVVEFLNVSNDCCERIDAIRKFSVRKWTHVLEWLDAAGLAFYFLRKLKDTNATDAVPTWVLSQLEQNFAANQARVEEMTRRFGLLNRKFNEAGIHYAVVKGFSLVPEFCPNALLRHQGDLDYLVEGEFPAEARRVLADAGYISKESRSSEEAIYVLPGGEPSRSAAQYSAHTPHAVELHLDIWDSGLHGVPSIANLFSVGRARTRHWNGLAFPGLTDEDAFLLQVVHACHHFFTLWIRMSCLFEIAYFLNRRSSDVELWNRIEERAGDNAVLREFVVIVSEMAAQLFAAPVPSIVQGWAASLRPASRVWIERYARYWAFCELPVYEFRLFPRSKLALFLRQQYQDTSGAQELLHEKNTLSSSRLARIASSITKKPSLSLDIGWWKRQMLVQRTVFHALAGARYVCEIPRWRWLNRASTRPVSLDGQVPGRSLDSDFRATN